MKVLVGISGGVDSSVSAYLLQQKGYEVVGVHFSLEKGDEISADAIAVCDKLGITLYNEDLSDTFRKKVFNPFIENYANGKTPNLCVCCNKFIKFGELFAVADRLGVDMIATGHYCSIKKENDRLFLSKPKDSKKDQTYFLNQVKEECFKRVLFPLENLNKEQVRQIAEEVGLITAHKKGSSDVCLMKDLSFKEFLAPYIKKNVGDIVDVDGNIVGKHEGIHSYTIGQRKGLGIGGVGGYEGRWFVVSKDAKNNRLVVSKGEDSILFTKSIIVGSPNFIGISPKRDFECFAKIRYGQDEQKVIVKLQSDNRLIVEFEKPQRAVAVGQYCVLYDESHCLGGGEIIG